MGELIFTILFTIASIVVLVWSVVYAAKTLQKIKNKEL